MTIIQLLSYAALVLLTLYALMVVIGGYYMHFSLKGIVTRAPKPDDISQYRYEDLEFRGANDNRLCAWYIEAQGITSDKTIILVHGWGHTRATLLPHIHFFVQNGFNVFAFDQRCHGASQVARLGFGTNEGADFRKALEYLSSRPDTAGHDLFAYGVSLGGAAIICGAPFEGRLKGIVWEGPWAFDECMTGYMAENRYGFVLGVIVKSALAHGAALWGNGRPNHGYPVQSIAKVHPTPVFFIRGANDLTVPDPCARAIIDAAPEPKEVWIHQDGGHRRALDCYPDEFKSRVLAFTERAVMKPALA